MRCRRYSLLVVACLLIFSFPLMGQSTENLSRITSKVDDKVLVPLTGNVHPNARAEFDRGPVSPDLRMGDLVLVLRRSAEQQKAFEDFVASQYDSSSANFHHWLTPDEIGTRFGPSLADIATISNWLSSQGFSVDEVAKDRMTIRFSGAASQVQTAFHTDIHNLLVRNEPHIANMSDPQIPAALAPVVLGVKALHNFLPRPLSHVGSPVRLNPETHKWEHMAPAVPGSATQAAGERARPQFGISVGGTNPFLEEDLAPYDWATIYNVLPLWTAATPIDGTGQTIAVAGTSNINLSDVATFRSTFGLPAKVPQVIITNTDPGVCANLTSCDQVENTLDVEWSGAIAKGAQIILVTSSAPTTSTDPLYLSVQYILNHSVAPIVSVSYGLCELGEGTAGNALWASTWKTAAAAGMSVFVATGDAGAATCDAGGDNGGTNVPYAAQFGLSVSGIASTPDNTAVGGTDLNWGTTATPYWNATNASNGSSAKGYIPETPWNDTCTNPDLLTPLQNLATQLSLTKPTDAESACNFLINNRAAITTAVGDLSAFVDTVGAGGGSSTCTTNDSSTVASCTGGYAQPAWQTAVSGIPTDGKRAIPDVSFFASNGFNGSAYLICVTGTGITCTYPTNALPASALEIGGTSASTPAMAGVMALINQKLGSPQGNAAPEMYKLAAQQNYGNCVSSSVTNSSSCYFNDITTGTIAMPCDNGLITAGKSPDCTVNVSADKVGVQSGYAAGTAYDRATGLGSMNVANTVNAWAAFVGTSTTTMTVVPSATTIAETDPLSVVVTVTGSSTIGNPTGTVSMTEGRNYNSGPQAVTASGTSSATYTFAIPGGSLHWASPGTFKVTYSGDTNYAANTGSADVTINGLTPTVTVTPASANVNSGSGVNVTVTVAGTGATPTGIITLAGGGYHSVQQTLDSTGKSVFTIPAYALTTAGAVTLTADYVGDNLYYSVNGTAGITVTISTFTLAATDVSLAAGASSGNVSTVTVTPVAGYTGTVALTAAVTSGPSGAVSTPVLTGSSVTINSAAAQQGTIAVATIAPTAVGFNPRFAWLQAAGGTALAALLFLFVPFGSRRRRRIFSMVLVVIAAGFTVAGCGGGGHTLATPTVSVTPSKTTFSSSTAISATISVSGGTQTPTGTVTLTGGGFTSSAASLSGGSATINIPANSLSVGSVTLTASYSGDTNFNSATGIATVTVNKPGTTTGAYTITVTGTGSDAAHTTATTTFNLTVN